MGRLEDLREWLREEERVVVALSGGVDSVLLTYVAHAVLGDDMIAVTGDSPALPAKDKHFVQSFCKKYGIKHGFIGTAEFEVEEYRKNSPDRCYFCKKSIFEKLADFAARGDYNSVLDGTNASDLSGHRPGYKALLRCDMVRAPYVELGITKDDIREMSRSLGLDAADKPASACLASRIPWGRRIEPCDLKRVDEAEDVLRGLGFTQVRVRHHGDLARIQIMQDEVILVLEKRKDIDRRLKDLGYKFVTLDLLNYGQT